MIEANKLTKQFGFFTAVNAVSFTTEAGEIVGLLGPNGAGKTTLMRMLASYMPPSDGSARVAGFDVVQDSFEVRKRVGYLPEVVPVYPDMTVAGYVRFWAELRGVRRARQRTVQVLEQVQLADRSRSLVRQLSKGMRQRLGLAQAIVHDPQVIILDEPTIGIDPQQVIEVREMVRHLSQNHTILFSTHILSEAEQICDRVLIINEGRIIAQGAPATLREQLQSGDHLFILVDTDSPEQLTAALSTITGVTAIEPQADGYIIRVAQDYDVRAEVASTVMSADARLLEMRPVAMTLEDMFLDLVGVH